MEYLTDIMKPEDWEQVRSIYMEGIATGNSTFEADAPDWDKWDCTHLQEHRLVVRVGDNIIAWAALSPVSSRCIYSGVAELSIYVAAKHRDKGMGSALLKAIICSAEKAGLWTLQGGIFPENTPSLSREKAWIQGDRKAGKDRQDDLWGTCRNLARRYLGRKTKHRCRYRVKRLHNKALELT